MKLTVGITQLLPEWEILIKQIGVSYENLHPIKPIKPDQASVSLLLNKDCKMKKIFYLNILIWEVQFS